MLTALEKDALKKLAKNVEVGNKNPFGWGTKVLFGTKAQGTKVFVKKYFLTGWISNVQEQKSKY